MRRGGEDLLEIGLGDAASVAEIVSRVQKRVAAAKPGEWVRGRGWDEGKLAERRYVYAADLDAVSPQNPVILVNTTGHYATLNSYALRLADIGDATRNPANGTIDRDAVGHATGVLKEGALMPIYALVPKFTLEEIEQGILKEVDDLHREGVTAFKDTSRPEQWEALHELNEQGRLDERVCMLWRAGKQWPLPNRHWPRCGRPRPLRASTSTGVWRPAGRRSSWTAAPSAARPGAMRRG